MRVSINFVSNGVGTPVGVLANVYAPAEYANRYPEVNATGVLEEGTFTLVPVREDGPGGRRWTSANADQKYIRFPMGHSIRGVTTERTTLDLEPGPDGTLVFPQVLARERRPKARRGETVVTAPARRALEDEGRCVKELLNEFIDRASREGRPAHVSIVDGKAIISLSTLTPL